MHSHFSHAQNEKYELQQSTAPVTFPFHRSRIVEEEREERK
jgi:hypothetical protein